MNQHYECVQCGWRGHEDDLRSECVDPGDRLQPPEWQAFCPDCGNNWECMIEAETCTSCEDEFPIYDSHLCMGCTVDAAEYAMDDR